MVRRCARIPDRLCAQSVIQGPLVGASAGVNKRVAVMTVAVVLPVALGGQIAASGAANRTVTLNNIAFSPKKLSISKGSKVTFAFRDVATEHNVISSGAKRFKSIASRSSGSRSRTFTRAGTYRYSCALHPGMSGRIVVR